MGGNCQTLEWYYHNDYLFTSNTEMLFEEGTHVLNTIIELESIHNFSMVGRGAASHDEDGLPQPTSIIICNNTTKAGIQISNSSNIRIHNLKLRFCSALFHLTERNKHYACSLVLSSVQDASLHQVVISNATGCGLYMYNVFGNSSIQDSAFMHTAKNVHSPTSSSGNAKLFFDHNFPNIRTELTVDSSWFMYGETSKTTATGGLNVFIYRPNVHVKISNTTAGGNVGENGGNLALFLVAFGNNCSTIVIDQSRIINGSATKGGGLRFWSKQNHHKEKCDTYHDHRFLSIRNTLFQNNVVKQTGGAVYMAYYSNSSNHNGCDSVLWHATFLECDFIANGGNGAAMEIIEHSVSHHRMKPLFQTSLEDCSFEDNYMPLTVDGPILDFKLVEVSIINSTFTGSNTTTISLRNSYLNLYGEITFTNNTARIGGALKVCDASLVFINIGTHVRFVNNSAEKGGAIYVQQPCMDTSPLCFIQPAVPKDMPVIVFTKLMKLEFFDNTAKVAGDALYGGDFDLCTTIVPYHQNTSREHKHYWYSEQIFNEVFDLEMQSGPSWVSSNPRRVCFCSESQQVNNRSCMTSRDPIKVHPGEKFTVSVITVGQMNGSTSGIIDSQLEDKDAQGHSLVQLSQPVWSPMCVTIAFVLNTNRSIARIKFTPITTEIATHYKTAVTNLTIHILPCPIGFQLTDSAPYQCTCDNLLTDYLAQSQIACNITNKAISLPHKRMWIGCFSSNENRSSSCDTFVVTPNCDYYCRSTRDTNPDARVKISVTDFDTQCFPGHEGIMCGTCKPGYSRVIGGPLNCEKNCTNANLPLILVFLASAFALIVFIRILNLTVTEGTLNGLLVYAVVIQTHNSYFSDDQYTFGKICWVFISWINLTLGIKTCFYQGMDGYQQIWFIYANLVYFLVIIALIVLLSRRFLLFTRLFGRNIIKILATVVFLLYTNVLNATYQTMRFATLHTANKTKHYKIAWYYDGNIQYLGLKHAPLFLIALVCLVIMIFYAFSLLLLQCLQKRSDLWCLRWVERLRPFYEAYTGPCCDNYRFWPGFLLIVRSALYLMYSLIPTAYNNIFLQLKMILTAGIFVLVMALACMFPHGVYKKWPLNVLELSFFLNLSITSLILAFSYKKSLKISTLHTSVSISALTFLGILMYHAHCQVRDRTGWSISTTWRFVRSKITHMCNSRKKSRVESEETDHDSSDDEITSLLPETMPPVLKFDNYREPLLEV